RAPHTSCYMFEPSSPSTIRLVFWPSLVYFSHAFCRLPTAAAFLPPLQHFAHRCSILPTAAAFCPPLQPFDHRCSILPTAAAFCPPLQHFAHRCSLFPMSKILHCLVKRSRAQQNAVRLGKSCSSCAKPAPTLQ